MNEVKEQDLFYPEFADYESKPRQSVKILGHTVPCKSCMEEIASFYCPCGIFLCAFHMIGHKCLITLRGMYSGDLISGLR
jgi:hypothetical protein